MLKINRILSILVLFVFLFSSFAFVPNSNYSIITKSSKTIQTTGPTSSNIDFEISGSINHGEPRVAKPTDNGPYTTTYVFDYIPRPGDTGVPARIYYPTSGGGNVSPAGAPYNGLVFAPGAGGTEVSYSSWLSTIASWGFIITIIGTGGPCNQEVVDIQSYVLDYYEELNANSSSIFYNKINASACGGSGHSNGGWTAIAGAVADDRFKAVCTLAAAAGPSYGSGQANTANLHVPLQLVAGADDTTYLPSSDAYYSLANPIKTYIKIKGASHGGPFNLEYLISFYKYWLNGKKAYGTYIYGDGLQRDIDNNTIEFQSDLGLNPNPSISKTSVFEDELLNLTADGEIISPISPDRTIILYQWDLDFDGTYDWESATPGYTHHYYEQNGEYDIRFKITDSWDFTASQEYSITVINKKPDVDAGPDAATLEDDVLLFDGSNTTDTPSDIDSLLYQWDFGDSNWTTWDYLPTASHNYSEDGEYLVRLFVKDDDGEMSGDTLTVTVSNVLPLAKISVNKTEIHINEDVTFDAGSTWDTPSDISTLMYLWDFDDSDFAEGAVTEHSYDDEGKYTITLTVMDNNGAISTDSAIITVLNSPPTCQAMDDIEVDEDQVIMLTGFGLDTEADEKTLEYSWNFGFPGIDDSEWSSIPETEVTYTDAGVYTATLYVRDDDMEIGTDTIEITVRNVAPFASLTSNKKQVLEDETVKFDGSDSTDTESDISTLNYTWDFDDGSPGMYGILASHIFTDAGEYKVVLTVTDDNGALSTAERTISVENQKPSVDIQASDTMMDPDEEIIFKAIEIKDTISDIEDLTFKWNFGDKTSATGQEVTHSYSSPGRYTVTLSVEDDDGAIGEADITIRVSEIEVEEESTETSEGGSNWAVILVSIVVVVIIILVLAIILIKRKKREEEQSQQQPQPPMDAPMQTQTQTQIPMQMPPPMQAQMGQYYPYPPMEGQLQGQPEGQYYSPQEAMTWLDESTTPATAKTTGTSTIPQKPSERQLKATLDQETASIPSHETPPMLPVGGEIDKDLDLDLDGNVNVDQEIDENTEEIAGLEDDDDEDSVDGEDKTIEDVELV